MNLLTEAVRQRLMEGRADGLPVSLRHYFFFGGGGVRGSDTVLPGCLRSFSLGT